MKYCISILMFESDKRRALDDKIISFANIELNKADAIDCMNDIKEVIENYNFKFNF